MVDLSRCVIRVCRGAIDHVLAEIAPILGREPRREIPGDSLYLGFISAQDGVNLGGLCGFALRGRHDAGICEGCGALTSANCASRRFPSPRSVLERGAVLLRRVFAEFTLQHISGSETGPEALAERRVETVSLGH
jgi:hypothetical protein